MIDTTRLTHGRRAAMVASPRPALSVTERWADTLAGLARTHRARLAATDPSRPWLDGEASGGAPQITRAAAQRASD
jgi:hypothetical protein